MLNENEKAARGCRLCHYRVAIQKTLNSPPTPSCCFGMKVNDKERPRNCGLFTETDYYIRNPDAP